MFSGKSSMFTFGPTISPLPLLIFFITSLLCSAVNVVVSGIARSCSINSLDILLE